MPIKSDLVSFDRKSAARIARAVKRIEGTPANQLPKHRRRPATVGRHHYFGKTATCPQFPDYPTLPADTYIVQLLERWYTETPGNQDYTDIELGQYIVAHLAQPEGLRLALQEGTEVDCWQLPTRRGFRWWIRVIEDDKLTGGCLAENHPGRGIPFSIHLGTWQSSTDAWLYDTEATVTAIDWRYGVPYPDAGATGLFWPRKSDTYGTIWEVVALDCESPGECNGDYPT